MDNLVFNNILSVGISYFFISGVKRHSAKLYQTSFNSTFHKNRGQLINLLHYQVNGLWHNDIGPALISYVWHKGTYYLESEEWYKMGIKHCGIGPAFIFYELIAGVNRKTYECWYNNGILGRNGGPAMIYYALVNGGMKKVAERTILIDSRI